MEANEFGQKADTRQFSPDDQTRLDTARYSLTIEETAQLFADAGVPRSPRTITRFCQLGDLDCLRVETEKNFKWLVDKNSAEKRITELQQAINFTKKPYQDMSSYVETTNETKPDMSRHDETQKNLVHSEGENDYLSKQVEQLEAEVIHLRIEKSAKDQVINQMMNERKTFLKQLKETSMQLGEAKTRLQMLEAPRPESVTSHVQSDGETEAAQPETPPAPTAEPAKPGFFKRFLG